MKNLLHLISVTTCFATALFFAGCGSNSVEVGDQSANAVDDLLANSDDPSSDIFEASPARPACVDVTIYMMSSTNTISPGSAFGLSGFFTNCSSAKVTFYYKLTGVSSCGETTVLASARKTLDPNMTRRYSITYTSPLDTCPGPWVWTMVASNRSGDIIYDSASTIVTVL